MFVIVGTELVKLTIAEMIKGQCEEVVLEAEVTNSGALALYQNLGFIRDKRLHRYTPPTAERSEKRNVYAIGAASTH